MSGYTPIPMDGVSVIAAPSSRNVTYSDPTSILQNRTWLLADNEAGYWDVFFNFKFTPTALRLWNAQVSNTGTRYFSLTAQPSTGNSNLNYDDPVTGTTTCNSSCPLDRSGSSLYRDFYFSDVLLMDYFRLDITGWYGSAGGLSGIEVFGKFQLPSTSATSASTSSSSPPSTPTSSITQNPANTPATPSASNTSNRLSGGSIAAIVIGILALLSIITAIFIFRRRKVASSDEKFMPQGGRHEMDAEGPSPVKNRGDLNVVLVSELENTRSRRSELGGSGAAHELPGEGAPG